MLAVTEVNGCAACSFAHTKFALQEGMSKKEISAILSGELAGIPEDEIVAVLFAQHYADNRGKATKEAWERLAAEYGEEAALVILAFIRMMQVGNIYGLAVSSIRDRLRRKPAGKTSLSYEISLLLLVFLYAPLAVLQAILDNLRKKTIYPY